VNLAVENKTSNPESLTLGKKFIELFGLHWSNSALFITKYENKAKL
jgi:hypothetical protein